MTIPSVKVKYMDASAILRLYLDEKGFEAIREFYQGSTSIFSTSLCVMEALGVLKAKWQYGHIEQAAYYQFTHDLIVETWSGKLQIDDVGLFGPEGQKTVEPLAKKYSLDMSDALQLATVLHGKHSGLSGESSSVLVTADKGLADAAQAEGVRTWNCNKEARPDWVD